MIHLLALNLRLWGNGDACDLVIADGRLVPPEEADNGHTARPPMLQPTRDSGVYRAHIHRDKAITNQEVRPNVSGTLGEAVEIIWERNRVYSESEVASRASRVIDCSHNAVHESAARLPLLSPCVVIRSARSRCCRGWADNVALNGE
jgi:hypothetical protein